MPTIFGICGPIATGKTTVAKLLTSREPNGAQLKVAYQAQDF